MQNIIPILFLMISICDLSIAQNKSEKIYLSNWGYIELPVNMEVQAGIYKQIVDISKLQFSINSDRVVFQQAGVNIGTNLNTYARVIIRTDFGTEILPDLNNISLTVGEVKELNDMYKYQLYKVSANTTFPAKIIKWNNLKVISLNGNKCLNYSYIRKMGDNPQTYSEFFIFFKSRNQHTLNIEYRITETERWKSILNSCVNSFRFNQR